VRDALKSYLALASGLTDVTRQRAVAAAKALVSQGEATAEQVSTIAEDLLAQTRSNREAVTALVKYEVDRTLGRLGLAANDEVTELTKRVRSLEAQIRELSAAAAGGSSRPTGVTPPSAAAKKTAAKKTATKRAVAKKTATKRAVAKKTGAKRTATKRTVAKKTAAKKATPTRAAKKTAAKRPAKKTAGRTARKKATS
jgi:polyhydroxyalkanoate synthesis regulator phasin